jgi:perosamine synthetase
MSMTIGSGPACEVPIQEEGEGKIVLFRPHIPAGAASAVSDTLGTRWIGQGPKVDEFERRFSEAFCEGNAGVSVGSGTDALHLAYLLADIGPGDEVIVPVFTCTATNIPLLYQGATIRFADVEADTLNINVEHVRSLVNGRTKAIVVVHYGGLPCNMDEIHEIAEDAGIPVIEDAAHAVGATYKGRPIGSLSEFTMFSFQAIKHITTGDGGLLTFKDEDLLEKAKRLRWFGIDRSAKQLGVWENDITEVGYKYQLTDIGAAMGLAALDEWNETIALRKSLLKRYSEGFNGISGIEMVGDGFTDREHGAWMCTVLVDERMDLQRKLLEAGIESNQVHYRNDRYSIFGGRRDDLPNMDALEDKYLVLPLHTAMTVSDVDRVVEVCKAGW